MNSFLFLFSWFVRMNRTLLICYAGALLLVLSGGFIAPGVTQFILSSGSSMIAWVLGVVIILRLVLGQPYLSTDSFWRSRPFTRRSYLMGQLLFVLLCIALPLLLVMFIHTWNYEGLEENWSSAVSHWLIYAASFFAIFAAAVHSRGFGGALGLIGLTFVVLLFTAYLREVVLNIRPVFEEWIWNWALPITAIFVTALAFLPDSLIKGRRLAFMSSLIFITMIVSFLPLQERAIFRVDYDPEFQAEVEVELSLERDASRVTRTNYITYVSKEPDVAVQPQSISVKILDEEIAEMMVESHNSISNESLLTRENAFAAIQKKFSADTRFFNTENSASDADRFTTITKHGKGAKSEFLRQLKVESPTEGQLIVRRYRLLDLPPLELKSDAITTGGGVKISYQRLDFRPSYLNFSATISRHTTGPMFRQDFRSGLITWVLYSPSKKVAMVTRETQWYQSDDYAGPALRLGSDQKDFFLNSEFEGVTDLELHPCLFLPMKRVALPVTVKAGTYESDWSVNHVRKAVRELVESAQANDPKLITAIEEMKPFQIGSFRDYLIRSQNAEKVPVSVLLKAVKKYWELASVLESHPDREAVIAGCADWLAEADEMLHPVVVDCASRSHDAQLIPALMKQFEALTYRHENVLRHLREMGASDDELRPLVIRNWRKGHSRLNIAAAAYGEEDAFYSALELIERSKGKRQASAMQKLKAILHLSEEQKTWDRQRLLRWLRANASEMKFDASMKKYRHSA